MVRNPLTPEQIDAGRRLGQALRAARGEKSLDEVAAAAQMSPETLRKVESGRLPSPAFGSVVLLCRALDLDVEHVARVWLHGPVVVRAG
ncbi:helix-turn-helix transcriptional regulator [Brooklawnia cerclae]|uniref:Transcriptional regulator with XRE-family HTH domain n=1 Tax=Brooklawnia cerclae TaxID=349934 RepID=A0ABX0SP53_9ACTN|nr:helix-turn-helix transcriptional regulator [Brooklawnia cerclae]NIH58571.1 transcriptional regulator with XRE-family HTH domain [Brooklawnia cerclae]